METDGTDPGDQVMIVAYFPETLKAITVLNGAARTEELHRIRLPSYKERMEIEVYISFLSEDRNNVSDSAYIGKLIWENNTEDHGNS